MKAAQLKITTGIFQRVHPLSSFLYLISLVDVVSIPLTEGNNQDCSRGSPTELSFFSPPGQIQNQIQLLLVLQKIKALPKVGQQLYSKNGTAQVRVLIMRRIWIPY